MNQENGKSKADAAMSAESFGNWISIGDALCAAIEKLNKARGELK